MKSGVIKRPVFLTIILVTLVTLLVSACSGVSQADLDAAKAQLQAKEQELAQVKSEAASLQTQIKGSAPVTVIQTGELQPAPAGAQPSGWDTAESIRGGWRLLATYDSSGPDAWDVKAHPLVYITSEGEGYRHRPSATNKLPGVQVIDGYTKQVVASALFDLGNENVMQPHGLALSPGGEWIYIGDVESDPVTKERWAQIFIINARTLKLDKVLARARTTTGIYWSGAFHHGAGFIDWEGRERVLLMGGFGAIGGPHIILDPRDDNRVVRAITADDVRPMGHPYPNFDPTGKFTYLALDAPWISEADAKVAAMAKFNLETGDVTIIEGVGNHPIGVAWTSDGKFSYVIDGANSLVYKIDNETNEVVKHTSAGVAGPYGLRLNWDETLLYTVGKGESSHNTGGNFGIIDLKTFKALNTINQPIDIGGATMDHAILHPDPEVNELWFSSGGTWETIVVDTKTNTVTARIPSPNGGDTHSGGFIRYKADWTGELLFDMGGPSKASYEIMQAKVSALKK